MKKLSMMMSMALLISGAAVAQNKIGVKAGLNLNHISTNDADLKGELSARPSIHFGLVGDFSLGKQFSFQPQLLYSGRGAKKEHDGHKDAYTFSSIEMPLNVIYKSSKVSGLFVGAGPVLGYNLQGKLKGHDESSSLTFGSGINEFSRFDVGANAIVGYQTNNGFWFSANYTLGLSNWRQSVNSESWRNNILGVSVGYFFNKAKK